MQPLFFVISHYQICFSATVSQNISSFLSYNVRIFHVLDKPVKVFFPPFPVNLQLEFCSFNADDEDYEGYEYSLHGQLSEVRVVYLNRFIQEVWLSFSFCFIILG